MSTACRNSRITSRLHAMAIPLCLLALMLCIAFSAAQLGLPGRASADERTTPAFAPIVKDAKANAANLVLIVEFSDSPAESFYDKSYTTAAFSTNFEYLMADINSEASTFMPRTYRSYMQTISKGKFNIASYFPQAYADGTHLRIRVSMSSQDYMRNNADSALMSQAIGQLMIARPDLDASVFDADNDGYVDNVLIIADLPQGTEITAHANTGAGPITVGSGSTARTANALTALNGGGTAVDRFDSSVAVHERMHTLGAADYYRNSSYGAEGNPVENWDVMAKGALYSWPLAYTRERVGWTSVPEMQVGADGISLSLYAPAESDDKLGSKPQAIKIKSPLSTSEYFVIEYRKKGSKTFDYDRYIGASGLIVYRVNEQYANRGNLYGDDFVYVFRPGETSLTASAGDISRAPICAGSYTTQGSLTLNSSIGSLDPNAGITNGAICYSNGTNSGLLITATSQTDSSITVTVKMSSEATDKLWSSVANPDGSTPLTGINSPATRIATDGKNLYVLAEDRHASSANWAVYKHDGANWSKLGTNSKDLKYIDLAWFNGSLYAAGINGSSIELKRFNGSSWVTCASIPNASIYPEPRLSIVGSKLYVLAYAANALRVYTFSGSALSPYGNSVPVGAPTNPILVDLAGTPAVVAGDTSQSTWKTSLYKLENVNWKETRLVSNSAASIASSVRLGNKSFVYIHANGEARLFEFDATGALVGNSVIGEARDGGSGGSLTADGTHLYLSIGAGNSGTISYKLANGSAAHISQVGGTVYSSSFDVQNCVANSKIYAAIADVYSSTIAVRSHDIEASSTPTPDPPVSKQNIANATVSSIPAQTYTGRAITPQPVVTLGTKKLVAGTDYTITYANNVNVGTATITIKGMGNYAGTKTARFTIVKAQDPTPTPDPKPDPTPTPDPDPTPTPKPDPTPTPTPDPTPTPKPDPTPTPDPTPEPTPTPDPDPTTPEIATTVMHRLYNPNSGEHFYTASEVERDHLVGVGWNYEGAGWTAPSQSDTPVYRLYNANAGDHHYTTSVVERDHLVSVGWNDEGIGWYSDDSQRVPLFRQYNPNAIAGSHNYTTSKEETDMLIGIGWHDEGIGWYGV